MTTQGAIDIFLTDGSIERSTDMSQLIYATQIGDLPSTYGIGQKLVLSFDFAPLSKWVVYKSVANQKTAFNASEWVKDTQSPYIDAITAAQTDGALASALSDGTITITLGTVAPSNPNPFDIWQCPASSVPIGMLTSADQAAFALNAVDDVYFYYGLDKAWHLCSAAMKSAVGGSISTKTIKSQASVMNTVTLPSGKKLINGWTSLIQYQNGIIDNDFGVIADNFYVGSTDGAYKPFVIDTVNHKIKMSADVVIDGNLIVNNSITTSQLGAQSVDTVNLKTGVQIINGYIASSDFFSIGGSGFRLKSNAAGTSVDPTIYGAYVKGGTIEGAIVSGSVLLGNRLVSSELYPDNTTKPYILKSDSYTMINGTNSVPVYSNTLTLYSKSYSSGQLDRVVNANNLIHISLYIREIGPSNGIQVDLQQSIDGGAWTKIMGGWYPSGTNPSETQIFTPSFTNSIAFRMVLNNGTGLAVNKVATMYIEVNN
jgi:hypothetical protein